tara:strand:+ start:92 stop:199 length:108 start_codon:yes stop_codon:yes gene_type:complete
MGPGQCQGEAFGGLSIVCEGEYVVMNKEESDVVLD